MKITKAVTYGMAKQNKATTHLPMARVAAKKQLGKGDGGGCSTALLQGANKCWRFSPTLAILLETANNSCLRIKRNKRNTDVKAPFLSVDAHMLCGDQRIV
jgi:hypothetical protein